MPHTALSVSLAPEPCLLAAVPMAQLVFGLSRGVPPNVLCETAGIAPHQLTDRDRFVPHAWHHALWRALRTHCDGVRVGIEFGRFMTPDHLGFAGQVFRHARDGLDMLHKLVQFGALFDSRHAEHPTRIEVEGDAVRVVGAPSLAASVLESFEASLVGFVTQLGALTDVPPRVRAVHCRLDDARHRAEYERIFDCPIHFGSTHDGIVFARASLLAPVHGANAAVSERIAAYVAETLAPTRLESFAAKLRWIVAQQLHAGAFSQSEAARALGMGVRTLQRRLVSNRTSFVDVVEDVRRAHAERMLDETDAAVYEIAFCLGYQDVSSFNRAFKRWHGTSPRAFRKRTQRGSAHPT
ncbi:MAG: AraC family transcriptional regulator ligand-binding domain-containing protein [Polyangiales bacterium]